MSFIESNGQPKSFVELTNEQLDEVGELIELELGIIDPHKELVGFQLACLGIAIEDVSFVIPAVFGLPHPNLTKNRKGDPNVINESEWFNYPQNPPDDLHKNP